MLFYFKRGFVVFFGPVEALPAGAPVATFARRETGEDAGHEERIAQLEASIVELRKAMADLSKKFDDLFA